MKNSLRFMSILTLASFLISSCGVIFGGSRYSGSIIVKNHPNAQIYVNGNKIGQGTAIQSFPRNRPLNVQLKQAGCEDVTKTYDNTFRTGNFILSLVSWGLVGILIDLGTGASYKPDHRHNPSIQKVSDKNFVFMVDYDGCGVE